jgi:multiple sugar transport system ATP-binding protein
MGQITLKKVTKSPSATSGHPAARPEIDDGEFVVFVGPSGCGKSTLLRLIAGLEDVTDRACRDRRVDATDVPPAKRGLAMVFQSYALYPHMSVRKNIAFPAAHGEAGAGRAGQAGRRCGAVLNLTDYLDRRPGQLSGGQRQRVAIGRAIVREPAAFLFDEPLSNLDAALRVGMRLEISSCTSGSKTTMIYVTHDQVEAMTMADKIVVLQAGVIEQVGSPLELYQRPRNTFVAGFIGSPKMNLIEGPEAAKHERQHDRHPARAYRHLETEGTWKGTVGVSEHLGSDTFFHVQTATPRRSR